jgi:L,D-peptidoglycan transpeptidase YkuD (ErfK/YbiS/YcfS/YnhG family)
VWLTNCELKIRTSLIGSPGFSRIRRSWQDAAVPAGVHRLKWLTNCELEIRTSLIGSPGFSRIRRSGQDAAVPAGVHRLKWLMNCELEIRTSLIGSPGFSRIRRSWQDATVPAGVHRLKWLTNCELEIRTSLIESPGFSRIRRSWQDATVPAGVHRLKPGLLRRISGYVFKLRQVYRLKWLMNCELEIRTSLIGSPGFSRIRRSWQDATVPAGVHRRKPGLLSRISGLCFQTSSSRTPVQPGTDVANIVKLLSSAGLSGRIDHTACVKWRQSYEG